MEHSEKRVDYNVYNDIKQAGKELGVVGQDRNGGQCETCGGT